MQKRRSCGKFHLGQPVKAFGVHGVVVGIYYGAWPVMCRFGDELWSFSEKGMAAPFAKRASLRVLGPTPYRIIVCKDEGVIYVNPLKEAFYPDGRQAPGWLARRLLRKYPNKRRGKARAPRKGPRLERSS